MKSGCRNTPALFNERYKAMNLIYLKMHIIDDKVTYPEKIIEYCCIKPIDVVFVNPNCNITFTYCHKFTYTNPKCIQQYLSKNDYIATAYRILNGHYVKDVNPEHIFFTNVNSEEALLTDQYRLYDALTKCFVPDPLTTFDKDPLVITFAPYKYQNEAIYSRIRKWIAYSKNKEIL